MSPLHQECEILPCRALALLFMAIGAAAAVLSLLYLPLWLGLPAASGILLATGRAIRHHAIGKGRDAVTALRWGKPGLELRFASGHWHPARVLPHTFVHPRLTVLASRIDDVAATPVCLLVPGRLDAEVFRRLRAYLQWGRLETPGGP